MNDRNQRDYRDIPFNDRDLAKTLGAQWDRDCKAWYVPPGVDKEPFEKWPALSEQAVNDRAATVAADRDRDYRNVPHADKDSAKALGAQWDRDSKAWYIPHGVDKTPFERWPALSEQAVSERAAAVAADRDRDYRAIPFADKHQASVMGAKWDRDCKAWYIPQGVDKSLFEQWPKISEQAVSERAAEVAAARDRDYREIPFTEKGAAKALGAQWDRDNKAWYVPHGVDKAPFEKWPTVDLAARDQLRADWVDTFNRLPAEWGAQKHPELQGAYDVMDHLRDRVQASHLDTESQGRVLEQMRHNLAAQLGAGQLPELTPELRQQAERLLTPPAPERAPLASANREVALEPER